MERKSSAQSFFRKQNFKQAKIKQISNSFRPAHFWSVFFVYSIDFFGDCILFNPNLFERKQPQNKPMGYSTEEQFLFS